MIIDTKKPILLKRINRSGAKCKVSESIFLEQQDEIFIFSDDDGRWKGERMKKRLDE